MSRISIDLTTTNVRLPEAFSMREPTHVSRYWIISQMVASIAGRRKVKILDVGGKEGLLRSFGLNPTVIDIEASDEPDYVQGNALDMPFADKQFDIAVSCDVLEHIAPADRDKFISEMLRVSEVVIICAPFDHGDVAKVEVEVNGRYKALLKKRHRWLGEHIENGLPSEAKTAKVIQRLGYEYVKTRHFSTNIWLRIMEMHLLQAAFGDSKDIVKAAETVYETYYNGLCEYDFSEDGYRTFFIVSKQKPKLIQRPEQQREKKKDKFMTDMTDTLFGTAEGQAKTLRRQARKQGSLKASLAETTAVSENRIRQLEQELNDIKSSKKWRLAQKLVAVKTLGRQ